MSVQIERIERLYREGTLPQEEMSLLIEQRDAASTEHLFALARTRQQEHFGKAVYLRGLIEFSNVCRNDCLYCGLRRSNRACSRYRLTPEQILESCRVGYAHGLRTFVLQGGEDAGFGEEPIARLIEAIKSRYPDCAITLSAGEWPRAVYARWRDAGADRYLLRHETADPALYARLHPAELTLEHRVRCLWDLKDLGFQVGAGMMIQPPGQTLQNLVTDLCFLQELQPQMIGIGPFIPQKDTPLRGERAGSLELTLFMLAVLRLLFPKVLLPATTALGTIDPIGREKGVLAGANVIMPNLSPEDVRSKYTLYDGKNVTGIEAFKTQLADRLAKIGYEIGVGRGDAPGYAPKFMQDDGKGQRTPIES